MNFLEKANADIRLAIQKSGFRYWQIASEYGCSRSWFTNLLRMNLDTAQRQKILDAINRLDKQK